MEVSSKGGLSFSGTVDTRAPIGINGTLLLDPEDIVVGSDGTMTVAALRSGVKCRRGAMMEGRRCG